MAAAVEAGVLSDADLIILTPTLEDLDLLDVPFIGARWMAACERAENARAANMLLTPARTPGRFSTSAEMTWP